ncbi:expressed unknown protein [Seminavis robusta]|uniref:Uncharacterized protein n=1 Tax=Seminavis robusta TaxID=568900 RepID=A0A9N8DHU5_9STRA|nr:expressed unknown protein [Seminavis robusta]|eukprot:Sro129_g061470.1 n/a (966) ;mRNA; f:24997-28024
MATRFLAVVLVFATLPALGLARQFVIWSFGNSLSSYGGSIVGNFRCFYIGYATQLGATRVDSPRYTPGGATFGTHWAHLLYDDNAPAFSNENNARHPWVFLQEQSAIPAIPSQLPVSLFNLRGLISHFSTTNVQEAFLIQTWGYEFGTSDYGLNYPDMPSHNQALLAGYVEMQQAVHSDAYHVYVAPCGLAWEKVYLNCIERGEDPLNNENCAFRRLYQDPVHPSTMGSYACALTVFSSMTAIHPSTQRCKGGISSSDANQISTAIAQAIEETFASGLIIYPFDEIWPTEAPTTREPTFTPTAEPTTSAPTRGTAFVSITLPPQTARPTTLPPSSAPTTLQPTTLQPTDLNENALAARENAKVLILGNEALGNFNVSDQFDQILENSLALHNVLGQVNVTSSTPEDATLRWHVNTIGNSDPILYSADDGADFDWIVLQEDVSLISQRRKAKISADFAWAVHVMIAHSHQAKTALLMMFGGRNGYNDGNGTVYADFLTHTANLLSNHMMVMSMTSTNYNETANPTYLIPAGMAAEVIYLEDWNTGRDPATDNSTLFYRLYDEDGVNPSAEGSYLIAVMLSSFMSGLDPNLITWFPDATRRNLQISDIDEADAIRIRAASGRAILQMRDRIKYPWEDPWPTTAPTVWTAAPTPQPVAECSQLPAPFGGGCPAANPSTIDDGMSDDYRGWYSLNNDGCCQDYCRWNGYSGPGGDPAIQTTYEDSFWACRPAGYSTCTYWTEYATPFTAERCASQGVPTEANAVGSRVEPVDIPAVAPSPLPECSQLPAPTNGACPAANPSTIDDGIHGGNDPNNGWYSLNNDGCCQDYCRWVGYSGAGGDPAIQTTYEDSFWACRPAGYSTCTYWTEYATPFTAERCASQGVPTEANAVGSRVDPAVSSKVSAKPITNEEGEEGEREKGRAPSQQEGAFEGLASSIRSGSKAFVPVGKIEFVGQVMAALLLGTQFLLG